MSIKSNYKSIASARRRIALSPRTNLVQNPSYEVNTTDDSIYERYGVASTVTFSQAKDTFVYGSSSLKIISTDPADTGQYFRLLLNAGTYSASCQMKTDSVSNGHFVARTPDNGYSVLGNEIHVSGTTGWSKKIIQFTLNGQANVDILVGMGSYGSLSSGTVWFDGLILELSATAGTYFDGSYSESGKPVSWTGTPHNSTSIETQ